MKYPCDRFRKPLRAARRGMTLVELLVVISLMVLLAVISIPALRPMLEDRQTREGARLVNTYLNRARIKAMQTGRPCGVLFERFGPQNNASLVLRQVEVPPPYAGSTMNMRVAVDSSSGRLTFYDWRKDNNGDLDWRERSVDEQLIWNQLVSPGDLIQFDQQGPYYEIAEATFDDPNHPPPPADPNNLPPERPRIHLVSPNDPAKRFPTDKTFTRPVPFKIFRQPVPTLASPVGLPRGIVVDLQFSGLGNDFQEDPNHNGAENQAELIYENTDNFAPSGNQDATPVVVMFSPSGEVDSVRWSGQQPRPVASRIYFLIGRWERVVRPLPEDGRLNFQDLTNYWVSVNPKNGLVSTDEMAPVVPSVGAGAQPTLQYDPPGWAIRNSRKFAQESGSIGGR
jgi:prepilin-type N-terminal cleavage/methylation domain-containing protein